VPVLDETGSPMKRLLAENQPVHLVMIMRAYPKNFIRAFQLPNARTPLVPTSAVVFQDSTMMSSLFRISMSQRLICTTTVLMHSAIRLLASIIVPVLKDSMEMACYVRMLMSTKTIIAVFFHIVITLLALMIVPVLKDSMEMACHVRMLTSA